MRNFIQFVAVVFVVLVVSFSASAFTSLRIYGDSLSCTTNNPDTSTNYYGERYSNGRVWVEILAQRQALVFNSNFNNSYYGNYSTNIWNTIKASPAPSDSNTTLVVVWANNADLFDLANDANTTLSVWTNTINFSQTNHYSIITNLYAKGVRSLVMPNVVDLSTIPRCNHSPGYTNIIRQKCISYNLRFSETLARARTNCPGLTIYVPDFFLLLSNLLAHPADYNVTNALYNYGGIIASVDAVSQFAGNLSITNNPGTNYIFWDQFNPSAKVHNWMANIAQQLISPAEVAGIVNFGTSNRLDLANVPIGQNGQVQNSSDLAAGIWATNLFFASTNTVQSVFVPATAPQNFYRLNYPVVWTWP